MIHKGKILLKKSAGLALVILLSGASIAAATLTFTGSAVTGDVASTIDVGSGNTLSIQTTANGPITAGSGLFTIPLVTITNGSSTNFAIVNASTTNVSSTNINNTGYITFASASGTNIGVATVSSSILTFTSASGTNIGVATVSSSILTFTNASGTNLGLNAVSSSYVSSTYVAANTTLTVGGGQPVSKISCTTTSRTLGAIAVAATTSIPFSLAGISTSSNQVYYFGHNTSSAGVANLKVLSYIPSSTVNGMDVTLLNPTSTGPAFAARTSATTFSLCYMQF